MGSFLVATVYMIWDLVAYIDTSVGINIMDTFQRMHKVWITLGELPVLGLKTPEKWAAVWRGSLPLTFIHKVPRLNAFNHLEEIRSSVVPDEFTVLKGNIDPYHRVSSQAPKHHPNNTHSQTKEMPVRRIAQIVHLKSSAVEAYKECHANVWPEVLQQIKDCNIRDCRSTRSISTRPNTQSATLIR